MSQALRQPSPDQGLPILPEADQPLVAFADFEEYRDGLNCYRTGQWHEDRWKTFRLRWGIYAQLQDGLHMVRAKIPSGRLSFAQARTAAAANRLYGGPGAHITTRQDFQFYNATLDQTETLLEHLYANGVTTREAAGNTFRNTIACPLAGICPHEHVDAGAVAERLATTWLRDPLVQHMPRKFKTSVSGCAHDCGDTAIDDLGLIATRAEDGRRGFRAVVGGGLGNQPRLAVTVLDFVDEHDLPSVQEACAILHHRYSNRANKNRSRIKFLVDKFGEDGFRAKFQAEFERVRKLPKPAWKPLDWRAPTADGPPPAVEGVVAQHDGGVAVVVRPPLGYLDSDQLDALTDLAENSGAARFTLTRDQNIIAVGLTSEAVDGFIAGCDEIGFEAGREPGPLGDVVACPGTHTCPIGITNSKAFAESLMSDTEAFKGLPRARIRVSGCHNSCGQHHIGDIGLHGIGKKIGGRPAPHYQIHFGGEAKADTQIGLAGPFLPAAKAKDAVRAVLADYEASREVGESIRHWAERQGKVYLDDLLAPYAAADGLDEATLFTDVGKAETFVPPANTTAECAAGAVVAEYLADLAVVARRDMLRTAEAGDVETALALGRKAMLIAARRLLVIQNAEPKTSDGAAVIQAVRSLWGHNEPMMAVLDAVLQAEIQVQGAGDVGALAEALDDWFETVDAAVEEILGFVAGVLQ